MAVIEVGPEFRPYAEVQEDRPDLRAAWWQRRNREQFQGPPPVTQKSIKPGVLIAGGVFALAGLSTDSGAVTMMAIAAVAVYVVVLRKGNADSLERHRQVTAAEQQRVDRANAPIPATAVDVLLAKMDTAIAKARNQISVDLGIPMADLEVAANSSHLISRPSYRNILSFSNDTRLLPGAVVVQSAVLTSKGLGYHSTAYDVVRDAFDQGDAEMMLWGRVSRIYRSGNKLVIEANSGGSREIPLDGMLQTSSVGESLSPEDVITRYVNPFMDAAQVYLQSH